KSVNELLAGIGFDPIGAFHDLASGTINNIVNQLVNGAHETLDDVRARLTQLSADLRGALGITDASQFEITFDDDAALVLNFAFPLSITQSFSLNLDDLNLPAHGTIPLTLDASLDLEFSFGVNFGGFLFNPSQASAANSLTLHLETFQAEAHLTSPDIDVALNLDGLGGLNVTNGTADLTATLGLSLTAPNGTISVADLITATSFSSLVQFNASGSLDLHLPVTLSAGNPTFRLAGTATIDFAAVVDFVNVTSSLSVSLAVTDGTFRIADFIYLKGNFAFQVDTNQTVQVVGNPTPIEVRLVRLGASGVHLFIGSGWDADNDGQVEDPDTNTGAIGIVLDDVTLGLALMKDPLSTKSYYALKASGTIHLVRLPGDLLSLTIQSLTVEVNGSRDSASPTATVPVVDFLASFG